jgi:hypothetical protein
VVKTSGCVPADRHHGFLTRTVHGFDIDTPPGSQ